MDKILVTNQDNYKRTIQDRFISELNFFRYSMIEPVKLAVARMRYEKLYSDPNEDPLVSITIPTYNRGQLLVERTLPSIFAQTYQNFEVVIVGDHCPDNTAELIAKLNHPKVRFFNLPKRGNYPSDPICRWFVAGVDPANKTLELVKGTWISFMDDDDIFTPDHIEKLLRFAQQGDLEFVAGLYEEERNGNKVIMGQRTKESPEFGGHSTWFYRSYLRLFKYNSNCWRKKWNKPGDIDMQIRMLNAGVRMALLEQVVSRVIPRPGLITVGLDAVHSSQGI